MMADHLNRREEMEGKVCFFQCNKSQAANVCSLHRYLCLTSRPAFFIRLFLGEAADQLRQRVHQVEGERWSRGPFAQIGF